MHIFTIIRGNKHDVDRTIQELNSKYLPFEHKTAGKGVLRVMANPIQFVEIICPEQHVSTIIKTLNGMQGMGSCKFLDKTIKMMRKVLRLEMPVIDKDVLPLPVHFENSAAFLIGVKKDGKLPDGTEAI